MCSSQQHNKIIATGKATNDIDRKDRKTFIGIVITTTLSPIAMKCNGNEMECYGMQRHVLTCMKGRVKCIEVQKAMQRNVSACNGM